MSTNFLQWNPAESNQETDAQYLADALRSAGIPLNIAGTIFPSGSANKLFYQLTTMVLALAQFITNQGLSALDSNLATLATNLSIAITSAALTWVSEMFSATPVFNCAPSATTVFEITLTGNVTSSTMTLLNVKGQTVTFIIHQDATGGHTFAWPTQLAAFAGVVDPTASKTSVQSFVLDGGLDFHPLGAMTSS